MKDKIRGDEWDRTKSTDVQRGILIWMPEHKKDISGKIVKSERSL